MWKDTQRTEQIITQKSRIIKKPKLDSGRARPHECEQCQCEPKLSSRVKSANMTPSDKTWESHLKNSSLTLCHREIFVDWGGHVRYLTCREAPGTKRGWCSQMSSVWERQEMSRERCAGGAGTLLRRPSRLAIGQKSWQLLALKCTENTVWHLRQVGGRLLCCGEVGGLFLYRSQQNNTIHV